MLSGDRLLDLLFFPTKGNRNAANIVTFVGWRLSQASLVCFAAYGAYYVATGQQSESIWWCGFIMAIVGAACDLIDGNLARYLGIESDFGGAYDPAVDKMQLDARISCLIIDLLVTGNMRTLLLFISLAYLLRMRNEKVTFLRILALKKNPDVKISAHPIGKARTVVNYVGIFCLHLAIYAPYEPWTTGSLMAIILAVDTASWFIYSESYAPLT